jgi:hypothetical protein
MAGGFSPKNKISNGKEIYRHLIEMKGNDSLWMTCISFAGGAAILSGVKGHVNNNSNGSRMARYQIQYPGKQKRMKFRTAGNREINTSMQKHVAGFIPV